MVNEKELREGIAEMRSVAQRLFDWADKMEASLGKKGRKKSGEAVAAGESEVVSPATVEAVAQAGADAAGADEVHVAIDVASVASAAPAAPAAPASLRYEDLRGLLAEKSAAGCRAQVLALIRSFGAEKLSEVDSAHWSELYSAALGLGGDGGA